jgi:hypothetical protein
VADASLLQRAADCYAAGGARRDAARCYRDAGVHAKAAEAFRAVADYDAATEQYLSAGMVDDAIWLLAHVVGGAQAARALDEEHPLPQDDASPAASRLAELRRLALARCDVADGSVDALRRAVAALDRATLWLADPSHGADQAVEVRAVDVAMAANRLDRAALVHAACTRTGTWGAYQRWQEWHRRVSSSELPALDRT